MKVVSAGPVVGIPGDMNTVTGLRHAQQRVVKVQRRLWLAQLLLWPAVVVAGVLAVVGVGWILRRRFAGSRHEMPDLPGAHEDGALRIEPGGKLTSQA